MNVTLGRVANYVFLPSSDILFKYSKYQASFKICCSQTEEILSNTPGQSRVCIRKARVQKCQCACNSAAYHRCNIWRCHHSVWPKCVSSLSNPKPCAYCISVNIPTYTTGHRSKVTVFLFISSEISIEIHFGCVNISSRSTPIN